MLRLRERDTAVVLLYPDHLRIVLNDVVPTISDTQFRYPSPDHVAGG